ncbi:MAG: hypothetical protein AB8B74_03200 [Crocinitomicaceae bacterium]
MNQFFKYLTIILLSITILGCVKQKGYSVNFKSNVKSKTNSTFTIEATISSVEAIDSRGVIYSLDSMLRFEDNFNEFGKIIDETNSQTRTYFLTNLKPLGKYYYRLYSIYKGEVKYGELKTICLGLGCGPAGGPIIYLDGNGGGIEVAVNYVTPSNVWGCGGTFIGGTEDSVGTGNANTILINNNCGLNTLANYCTEYEQNGYSDYYMPSVDELKLIYNLIYVNGNNPYSWNVSICYSSSEASINACKAIYFSGETQINNGTQANFTKIGGGNYKTIPVRSF